MKHFIIFILTVICHTIVVFADDDSCPEDYFPCSCKVESAYYKITCEEDASIREIRNVFSRIENKQTYNFELSISKDELGPLPADLLAGKKATDIKINCPNPDYKLKIDPIAFNTSKDREDGTLTISGCDLSELNFDFLAGFNELLVLQFTSCNFIDSNFGQFPTTLTKLAILIFENCTGLGELTFPELGRGLYALAMSDTDLDDSPISKILDWALGLDALPGNDAQHKLAILTINKNRLSRIPDQIKSFRYLEQFYLTDNLVPLNVPAGSLSFDNKTIPVSYLDLGSSQINLIEDGAFYGNFTKAFLSLISNGDMARFDQLVFKPILDDMNTKDASGVINLSDSPIECECNLAWLVRQGKKYMGPIIDGKCIDGRTFAELDESMFSDCP